jgi:hypothetical protein
MSSWRENADKVIRKIQRVMAPESEDEIVGKIPKKNSDEVADYVRSIYDDGLKYYEFAFAQSKPVRWIKTSPKEFLRDCARLENSDDYMVFGWRDKAAGQTEWVDGELQDQIRARNAFLNANWHDVTIQPNLKGINEIFDRERKLTNWGANVRMWTRYMQVFGDVWVRSYLDKSKDPYGRATEKILRPLSFVWTPECLTINKEDGCWYAVHAERVSGQWIKDNYPDLVLDSTASDMKKSPALIGIQDDTTQTYSKTHYYDKYEAFLDDPAFEEIPFDQNEFDERIADVVDFAPDAQGQLNPKKEVFPNKEEDNHKKWIAAYQDWLEERAKFYQKQEDAGNLTEQGAAYINRISQAVEEQIQLHEDAQAQTNAPEEEKLPKGKRVKYPFGRHIVKIGNTIATDEPNPYDFEWRILFHNIANEKIPERIDGRSDVEILRNTEEHLSGMMSHQADDELRHGHRQAWMPASEKAEYEKNNANNDPDQPRWYQTTPPQFPNGQGTNQAAEIYRTLKENAPNKLGVSAISHGEAPTKNASGDMVERLIEQNTVTITGEANQNLNDAIEDIVETRMMIWKKFYTNTRYYMIEGKTVGLVLSDYLSYEETKDAQGQSVKKEIPALIVTVRPNSNFPNKWESDLNLFIQLLGKVDQTTGMPLIPFTMVQDLLGERYVGLAEGGRYRQDSQALGVGRQVIAQQQQAAQEKQKQQGMLIDAVHKKQVNQMAEAATQPSNGAQ